MNPTDSVVCYEKAIPIYIDIGKYNLAAKCNIAVAEIHERQRTNPDQAIKNYEAAAEPYETLCQDTQASKCRLHVAGYAAEYGLYEKAIEIYEEVV